VTAEPALPLTPVDEQILHQERGSDHAHPVVHPSRGEQLAHPGIDDGVSGLALLPRFEPTGILTPGDGVVLRSQCPGRGRRMGGEHLGVELPPRQLPDERPPPRGAVADHARHEPRRDRAEAQVGGEPRRVVQVGPVALLVVAVDVFEEAFESSGSAGLAGGHHRRRSRG